MLCCLDPECCRLIALARVESGEGGSVVARSFALSALVLAAASLAIAGGMGS